MLVFFSLYIYFPLLLVEDFTLCQQVSNMSHADNHTLLLMRPWVTLYFFLFMNRLVPHFLKCGSSVMKITLSSFDERMV